MRKAKVEMDTTDSPKIYREARKAYLANKGLIRCAFCPYHGKENMERLPERNWKTQRKIKYKLVSI